MTGSNAIICPVYRDEYYGKYAEWAVLALGDHILVPGRTQCFRFGMVKINLRVNQGDSP